jgi:hypothetical protein
MFWSLGSQPYRNLDAVCRGIANRVGGEIDDAQLRPMSGAHAATECLFVATRETGWRFQTDSVAVPASGASGSLESSVYLARAGRLAGIETCGANGDFDGDFMICGLDGTGEHGACDHSSKANIGLGSGIRVRIHVDLQFRQIQFGQGESCRTGCKIESAGPTQFGGEDIPRFGGTFLADALEGSQSGQMDIRILFGERQFANGDPGSGAVSKPSWKFRSDEVDHRFMAATLVRCTMQE